MAEEYSNFTYGNLDFIIDFLINLIDNNCIFLI